VVVVRLEVVEVCVEDRERLRPIDASVDLFLDAHVAGQSGERRLGAGVA
jgi:hypothetical protein